MCIFCNRDEGERIGGEKTICIECMKNEDKLNIFHLLHNIAIITQKNVSEREVENKYFKLKGKKIDTKEIMDRIIDTYRN